MASRIFDRSCSRFYIILKHGSFQQRGFYFTWGWHFHCSVTNVCSMEPGRRPPLYVGRLLDAFGGGEQSSALCSAKIERTFGQVVYGLETGAAYSVGAIYHGLANNSMTDEQRRTLPLDSEEHHLRVGGSKLQLMGWSSYTLLLWLLKLCMNIFYTRLT